MKMDRRAWVLGGGALAVGGLTLNTPVARDLVCSGQTREYQQVGLARLGRACVACNPDFSEPLVAAEWAQIQAVGQAALNARIADDFAQGAIISVDGWQLARSEALVYAAAHYNQPTDTDA
ncbi:MAG: hypothetical protein Q8Q88_18640 [Phenylobacterium sp.]|uniref:hypothetical protein n=1 Tax=Phenylobacterium sp. TaxID=1871053 RepID=UPI00273702A6|nr:hypothetical protein [Phenylobacterium sp.]MDP3749062.1 hypothetical protein [Phenylobacterium sp.]